MEKVAYISVSYPFTVTPKMLNLSDDCSEKEFKKALDDYIEKVTDYITARTDVYHDNIDTNICGFEKGI